MKINDILTIHPNIQSGTPVFKGTRVPVAYLLEFLEDGLTIEQFIDEFPSVTYQQAIDLLEWTSSFLKSPQIYEIYKSAA
jgi:uncharacterized protein (DUF433 family)